MTGLPDVAKMDDEVGRGFTMAAAFGATVALVLEERTWVFTRGESTPGQWVTPATPFHVCSCSKTFTAAIFARLVQDGAVAWDDQIHPVLPEFEFSDAAANRDCTFRDLATMCVGLTHEGIAEWGIRQDLPREVRLARARHMDFVAPFRSRFSYSNLCYIALSLAAERLAGKPYPLLVRDLVCSPLGLTDSYSAGFGAGPAADVAIPHLPVAGEPRGVRDLTGPNSEGSARIHLSGRDATRWMRFLLNALGGSDAGPLSSSAVKAMATPWSKISNPDGRTALHAGAECAYGMGLFVTTLHGQPLLHHGGGGRGWRHAMVLAPKARAGVFVMASAESPIVEAWALRLLDILTNQPPTDWEGKFTQAADLAACAEQQRIGSLFKANLSAPLRSPVAGHYANPVTGAVQLSVEASRVRLVFADAPDFAATLTPLGGDVHEFSFDEPAMAPQPFDPPFRLRVTGTAVDPVLETSYFGSLRSMS